jgi:thermitase
LRATGLEPVRRLGFAKNLFQVRTRPGADAVSTANALGRRRGIVYAEPVLVEHIPQRFRPTDPEYGRQWQWSNDGSGAGMAGADVRAEPAWDYTRGRTARVAVIDIGFDVGHEDLAAAVSPASGFFDDSAGDAVLRRTLAGYPDSDHGTFCAGMAAAQEGNGLGGCGAAPNAELLLIAALDDQVGTQATLARAVAYAADPALEGGTSRDGATVISSSLGPSVEAEWVLTAVLEDAIEFAARRSRGGLGVPIFWASSNGNVLVSLDEVVSHPLVLAVGRSTRSDTEDDSAFGPELDFLAPGVSVVSTFSGDAYGASTGTSFAAPCAAGVGALVLTIFPLAAEELRRLMRDTCDKVGGVQYDANGHHDDYGHGRLNAFRAVEAVLNLRTAALHPLR